MLVRNEDFSELARQIPVIAGKHGGFALVNRATVNFHQFMLLGREHGHWWGACVDMFNGVGWRGCVPITSKNVWSYRILNANGIWILDDEAANLIGYAKEWLFNGKTSSRYEGLARDAIEHGKGVVLVTDLAGVVSNLLDGRGVSARWFKVVQIVKAAIVCPLSFVKSLFGFQLGKVARFLRPSGSMIAVLGTDGAGKSTVLNAVVPVLNQAMHNQVVVHHLRPDLLPPLAWFRGIRQRRNSVCTTPHASKPLGFVGSLFRVTYLVVDYVIGYWVRIRPHLAKIPTGCWIFDRYAYDMMIDPLRFRVKLPNWLVATLAWFAPRPDLIFCLGGMPEKIYARKPETSLEEVKRQVAALRRFCNDEKRAVWIDTTTSVGGSVDAMLKGIAEMMEHRRSG